MLDIISVESPSERVMEHVYSWLRKKLNEKEKYEIRSFGKLTAFEWKKQRVVTLLGEQTTRFPVKELTKLIDEHLGSSFQLWTRIPLSENTLRSFRRMEADGRIKFRCYIVSAPEDSYQEKESLDRIVKISQNRPLGAEWVSVAQQNTTSSFLDAILNSRNGLNYPVPTLAKVSSADTEPIETPLSKMMREHYSIELGRQIHWYPKKYVHKVMDEEKWGVDPLPKARQGSVKSHVLVTGTGRSGTTYFSDLLTLLGLDVGHQRNGNDGCSGAEFAIDHDWYPWFPVYGGGDCANVGERRSDYTYKHVLHIVRHPLWCIPSLMRNYPAINPEFWSDNGCMDPAAMDGSSIYRNACMYYGINKFIDESKQAEYRCQLEQIHEHWDTLMEILEMPGTPDPALRPSNQASGWGQYEPLTWEELEFQVGKTLANAIRQQARTYGYE